VSQVKSSPALFLRCRTVAHVVGAPIVSASATYRQYDLLLGSQPTPKACALCTISGSCVYWTLLRKFRGKRLRGRARCVVPGVSAAVAIAAWLGRALAVGVRTPLGGLDV